MVNDDDDHLDGYSMADIQYHWGIDGKGSVVLAKNLELPQFKVNKHRQMQKVEVLSTGKYPIEQKTFPNNSH